MPSNQEHVHLVWPLWSDLRVIPTHGEFHSLVRPMAILARSCLVELNRSLIILRVAFNEIKALRLPLALLVYSLNYNMHNMKKSVNELHAMLKLHEETLPKKVVAPALHAIREGKVQKNKNKKPFKAAKGVQGKGKTKLVYAPEYKPSYASKPKNPPPPNYLKELALQGLRGSKKLKTRALCLYMGNGQREASKQLEIIIYVSLVD
nr:zinc finger, CCHC-type [Tanacetum cinerariifolium]